MNLSGKATIVTGGASGIGYAIAERFVGRGRESHDRRHRSSPRRKGRAELSKLGEIRFLKANVANRADVDNLVAAAIAAFGGVDILVNNAGIVHAADFLDIQRRISTACSAST